MTCNCNDSIEAWIRHHVQHICNDFLQKHCVDFRTEERMTKLAYIIEPHSGEPTKEYLDRLYKLAK